MRRPDLRSKLASCFNPPRAISPSAEEPWAAVVAILTGDDLKELKVLLIKRRPRENDPWSGHVAFPGGFYTLHDANTLITAIREASEEVGVEIKPEDIVGMLDVASPINRPEVKVAPYVAYLNEEPSLALGLEVEDAFWAHLSNLNKEQVTVNTPWGPLSVEGYVYGGYVVWGVTARLLTSLIDKLKACV